MSIAVVELPADNWYQVQITVECIVPSAGQNSLRLVLEIIDGRWAGFRFRFVFRMLTAGRSICRDVINATGIRTVHGGTFNPEDLNSRTMFVRVRQVNDARFEPHLSVIEVQPIVGDPRSGNRPIRSPAGWCDRKRRNDDLDALVGACRGTEHRATPLE